MLKTEGGMRRFVVWIMVVIEIVLVRKTLYVLQ